MMTPAHKTEKFRRARLLQFLPLRRCGDQRHRPASRRDAARRLADHGDGRPPQASGRRRARGRPRRIFASCDGGAPGASADPHRVSAKCRRCRRPIGARRSSQLAPSPPPRSPNRSRPRPVRTRLAFFDAIAPIVYRETIDMDVAWFQSRYDKVGPGRHRRRLHQLPARPRPILCLRRWTRRGREVRIPRVGEGHALFRRLPADRGDGGARRGNASPRADEADGPHQPHKPHEKPYAVVQLRQDNALGTLFNMVGFQTKMKHGEQVRLFRTIPGLEKAEFARLGGLHRNTFLNSPLLLDETLRLKPAPHIRFAGQITGCEGYVESAAVGLMAARFAAAEALGARAKSCRRSPPRTARSSRISRAGSLSPAKGRAIPADEHQFRPVSADRPAGPSTTDGKRLRGTAKDARAKARPLPPRAARLRCMARREARRAARRMVSASRRCAQIEIEGAAQRRIPLSLLRPSRLSKGGRLCFPRRQLDKERPAAPARRAAR